MFSRWLPLTCLKSNMILNCKRYIHSCLKPFSVVYFGHIFSLSRPLTFWLPSVNARLYLKLESQDIPIVLSDLTLFTPLLLFWNCFSLFDNSTSPSPPLKLLLCVSISISLFGQANCYLNLPSKLLHMNFNYFKVGFSKVNFVVFNRKNSKIFHFLFFFFSKTW